jgi:hypothetical protein
VLAAGAAAGGIMTVPDGGSASAAVGAEIGESRRPVGGAGGDAFGAILGDAAGPCAAAQVAAARSASRTKATPRAISARGEAVGKAGGVSERDRLWELSEAWEK